jgi:hypothetical protein
MYIYRFYFLKVQMLLNDLIPEGKSFSYVSTDILLWDLVKRCWNHIK